MARRREMYGLFYEGDFGLSALTERLSREDRADVARALELAAEVAGLGEGEGGVELAADTGCLLGSGLPEDVLHTAWLAATHGRFDPGGHGMTVRDWLRRLAAAYPARPREQPRGRQAMWHRPDVDERELRAAVVAEVHGCADDMARAVTSAGTPPAPSAAAVPAALERIVREADADLGLRFFLRVLKAYGVPVAKDRYDRLMELDARLGYPGPLVYDGLTVRWPPVDPARRDGSGDFGLSALTSWFAHHTGEDAPRERVRKAAADDGTAETPGSAAAALLVDVTRLLDSPLPDDTLTTLWAAASDRGLNPDLLGMDTGGWLRLVAEVCRERLREVAPSYAPVLPPVRADLADDVLREVRQAAPLLADRVVSPHWHPIPGTTAAAAVEEVTARVDPDLGFRLFLRLLRVLHAPLTEERYARCVALGARFGHGELLVSGSLDLLVRHD
ncbi:hypothetical protein AB0A69_17705 [Streptomyces sp. NPDC045431]|uniref:hypothetical protein n=1 Tax=Streptomyces sp. NPDC045431 TaxID=3155613 RepID=UPI0033D37059